MPKLLVLLEDAMTDSRVQQRHNLMPPLDIITQVKAIETASWVQTRPNEVNCRDFDVTWLEESDNPATTSTNLTALHLPLCDIDGEELQSNKKTYKLSTSTSTSVKIYDDDCGNMFDTESKVSLALLQAFKKVLTEWAEAITPRLYAGAGANLLNTAPFSTMDWNIGTADGAYTDIDPASLTPEKSVLYLSRLFQVNKLQNPRIIDSGIFAVQAWLANIQRNTGNADTGQYNAWNYIADRYSEDFINMVNAGFVDTAFIIDQGSWAMPTVSFFPRLGGDNEYISDYYRYSVPIPGFSLGGNPVYVDMTYKKTTREVGSTDRCELAHIFHIELKWDLWQAPKYTSDTVTGTIALQKGEAA